MNKEYGGYLPLELKRGNEYYNALDEFIIRTNSGLTAIYCAIKSINPTKVYIPHYICETVRDMIASMGIKMERFYISDCFEPLLNIEKVKTDECVILVNYFGICGDIIEKYSDCLKNLIIDNTQAFFCEPVLKEGVFNVYSCRKFIGTTDGGYCISLSNKNIELDEDYSSNRYLSLIHQIEYGTNYAYKENLESYLEFKTQRKKMSAMTIAVLKSVDYNYIINSRKNNFCILDVLLGNINKLNIKGKSGVPYTYPVLVDNADNLRTMLVSNKIYIPMLWKEKITEEYENTIEYNFSRNILHLPVDQRYNTEDMMFISEMVKKGLHY